ncbi:MAG: UDP-N-acetylmuramoyl-tripeptide--D-alanyl-D-alanine ligase [Alphaproteobacteria bacterium]|nr:UDP-N-acetylmuramoyl-tripeptide--D-alanyl-D-alanine ligase [Alphaproteobacteria bacterium]MBQ9235655.1 UDP-N-acetylmuramoyl-tripeptide--D-alanyl-D-alanine ligase [Alphaproteobacteria bacterium]
MQKISTRKLAEILECDGIIAQAEIERVTTDSRKVAAGDLFVALRGEKFDGHNFVNEVLQKGAAAVIVDHKIAEAAVDRQLVVADTLKAFGRIGAYNRQQFKGKVIGLTGSSGKTTTKEELKAALSQYGKVYATQGNFNNNIGVPITLCDMDMTADFAIIEMGMSAKGEIAELTAYARPDMAIVTNVYPMHIEFFENLQGIAEAKAEIFQGVKKGGAAIINEDTNFADILQSRAEENGLKVYKFGKQHHSELKLQLQDDGEHNFYNAWCVLKTIEALGLDEKKSLPALNNFTALAGRGAKHHLRLPKGGEYTLIDDSYSGQPEACKLAIEALAKMEGKGRKILVLGKMAELGATSKARHIEIGQAAEKSGADVVIGVCEETKDLLAQVSDAKEKHYFASFEGVDEFLLNNCLQNNDIVLIKGARYSSKMYKVSESLIEKGKH